jgi:hypothetical protein
MWLKLKLFALVLLLVNSIASANESNQHGQGDTYKNDNLKPADWDLFCSGILLSTSELMKKNLSRFSNADKKVLEQLIDHLDGNGKILLTKGTLNNGELENSFIGMRFAEEKIGNDFLAVLKDGTDQKQILMDCLNRNQ